MLLDALKKSGVLEESDSFKRFSSPTGFSIVDVLGGDVEQDINGNPYLNWGLTNKNYMWVGESAVGKTTMAIQLMAGSIEWWNNRYPEKDASQFIMIDVEDNTELSRIFAITGWTPQYLKNHFSLQKMVDVTEIYNLIVNIANEKEKNKTKYTIDTDILDIDGTPVTTWIPTYILIDSIAAMKSNVGLENYAKDREGNIKEIDQISGNIEAMREAKANTDFILKIKPLLNKYGIVLISINHLVQETQMSLYEPLKRYLPMLKPGQRPKGGKALIFQAAAIGCINPKEKLNERNPLYGDQIYGIIGEFSFVKSKMSVEGVGYRMIFDSRTGYRPELSDFEYLQNTNYGINGSPIRMWLAILPEVNFTRKTLFGKIRENPILARAIQFQAKIKMVYDILFQEEAPDLSYFENLPYDLRIALIMSYTYDYPGLSLNLDNSIYEAYGNGIRMLNSEDVDLQMSYLTKTNHWLMDSSVDGLSLMPIIKIDRTIDDDPKDFIIEKDPSTGKEFWFKRGDI